MADSKPPKGPGFDQEDVFRLFDLHPPHGTQVERYEYLRGHFIGLANWVRANTQPSPEQTIAIRELKRAMSSIIEAIACVEEPPTGWFHRYDGAAKAPTNETE